MRKYRYLILGIVTFWIVVLAASWWANRNIDIPENTDRQRVENALAVMLEAPDNDFIWVHHEDNLYVLTDKITGCQYFVDLLDVRGDSPLVDQDGQPFCNKHNIQWAHENTFHGVND